MAKFFEVIKDIYDMLSWWYWAILVVLALIVISMQLYQSNYAEEERNKLLLEQGVDTSLGDVLVTCNDGSTDIYKPRNIVASIPYVLCGEILDSQTKSVLDTYNK